MARSSQELMGLRYEAERMVREGTSRAEVARRLGVHPQTLAGWALMGGWRKCDIDYQRSPKVTKATLGAIREAHEQHREAQAAEARRMELMRAALKLIAEGSAEDVARLEALIEAVPEPKALEAPKVAIPPDERVTKAKSLGDVKYVNRGIHVLYPDGWRHETYDGTPWEERERSDDDEPDEAG